MTLAEKIVSIYPQLDIMFLDKVGIFLQNDLDEKGDYIAKWEHPTLAKPTDEELA